MTLKAKLLLFWNTIALLPAIISLLYWLLLSIYAAFESFLLLVFVGSVFLVVSCVVSSVRLKLRILRDVGDPNLRAVRRMYKGASHVNMTAVAVLYPITFGMYLGEFLIVGLFLLVAIVVAVPLRVLITMRRRQYEQRRCAWGLGKWFCPRCGVSLGFNRRKRRWMCLRCGRFF